MISVQPQWSPYTYPQCTWGRESAWVFNPANTHPLDRALTGKSITRSIETSYTTTVQSRRSHITLSWQTTQVNDYLALDGSSFIVRNSGHMFAWDDLKRATPSVLRQKDRLAGYVSGQRKPPGLVYLVYSIPSQISLMPWEVVVVDLCFNRVQNSRSEWWRYKYLNYRHSRHFSHRDLCCHIE